MGVDSCLCATFPILTHMHATPHRPVTSAQNKAHQSINQSINQSIDESAFARPINQSIDQTNGSYPSHKINQSIDDFLPQPVSSTRWDFRLKGVAGVKYMSVFSAPNNFRLSCRNSLNSWLKTGIFNEKKSPNDFDLPPKIAHLFGIYNPQLTAHCTFIKKRRGKKRRKRRQTNDCHVRAVTCHYIPSQVVHQKKPPLPTQHEADQNESHRKTKEERVRKSPQRQYNLQLYTCCFFLVTTDGVIFFPRCKKHTTRRCDRDSPWRGGGALRYEIWMRHGPTDPPRSCLGQHAKHHRPRFKRAWDPSSNPRFRPRGESNTTVCCGCGAIVAFVSWCAP